MSAGHNACAAEPPQADVDRANAIADGISDAYSRGYAKTWLFGSVLNALRDARAEERALRSSCKVDEAIVHLQSLYQAADFALSKFGDEYEGRLRTLREAVAAYEAWIAAEQKGGASG